MTTKQAMTIVRGASVIIDGLVHLRLGWMGNRTLCRLSGIHTYVRDANGTTHLVETRHWIDGLLPGDVCRKCAHELRTGARDIQLQQREKARWARQAQMERSCSMRAANIVQAMRPITKVDPESPVVRTSVCRQAHFVHPYFILGGAYLEGICGRKIRKSTATIERFEDYRGRLCPRCVDAPKFLKMILVAPVGVAQSDRFAGRFTDQLEAA